MDVFRLFSLPVCELVEKDEVERVINLSEAAMLDQDFLVQTHHVG